MNIYFNVFHTHSIDQDRNDQLQPTRIQIAQSLYIHTFCIGKRARFHLQVDTDRYNC